MEEWKSLFKQTLRGECQLTEGEKHKNTDTNTMNTIKQSHTYKFWSLYLCCNMYAKIATVFCAVCEVSKRRHAVNGPCDCYNEQMHI